MIFYAGSDAATMKVHLLHHAVDCVSNWGPLWAYTCFSFEGMNRHIKMLFHGNREMSKQVSCVHANYKHCTLRFSVLLQLAFNHSLLQILPAIVRLRSSKDDQVQSLFDSLSGKKR